MRVAVIGAGYWGKNLVRVFNEMGVLATICDIDVVTAERLALIHGVTFNSVEDTLNDETIDAVAIAAPAAEHANLAMRALNAEKHVFVEKPLALCEEDAESLLIESRDRGLTLMVGHLLQYHPGFIKLKSMVTDGAVGVPEYFYSNRLNFGKIRSEEDILWSFAPHDISMILSLAGEEPTSVVCIGSSFLNGAIADVTVTHLEFPSSSRGHIFVSWLHPFKEQRLVVIGSEGMITFDDGLAGSEKLQHYGHTIKWVDGVPTPLKSEGKYIALSNSEPLRLELEHFCECVASGLTPRTDGEEGLRVLRVLQRATASMLKNGGSI